MSSVKINFLEKFQIFVGRLDFRSQSSFYVNKSNEQDNFVEARFLAD